AELAIGRGQAGFLSSGSQVMAFVAGPFAGTLAEKHGPRLVVGSGLALMAVGLVGAAMATTYGQLVVCYGMAVGIGSGVVYVPLLGLIQRWFYKRRGMASGLATTGGSVGTLLFPLIAARAAGGVGWLPASFRLP